MAWPARRTQSYGILVSNLLAMLFLLFTPLGTKAQSGCIRANPISLSYDPHLGNPIAFDVCDLSFNVTLDFNHEYQEEHDYIISITYDPTFFDLTGTTPG